MFSTPYVNELLLIVICSKMTANPPALIKCLMCEIVKPRLSFSPNKLQVVDNRARRDCTFDARKMPVVICRGHSGQANEAKCSDCKVTKGRRAFNRPQFKKAHEDENGRCKACAKKATDGDEPGEVDADLSGEADDSDDDSEDDILDS